ncbi:HNH endonuclease [Flavobacterium sp.]|uniref:HNH endonuclease n=1 Tax=Flavobacterium sp. TaxID=239 RepID=UPI0025C2685F|nr:HNH endonuclease [Flavobacterium sp.]MBA4155399.1 HNH endonuclease [Flavobacterium sp.]
MTNQLALNKYCNDFKKLNRSTHPVLGKAPHKPILLLSVLQLIRKGEITSNRIEITPELVLAFKSNWQALVTTLHTCNFALPFFHLKSEPFWQLTFLSKGASSIKSMSTLNSVKDNIAFAEIDQALFLLMVDEVTNVYLEKMLLEQYFPTITDRYVEEAPKLQYALEFEIKNQMVNDTKEEYQTKIQTLENQLTEEEFEEERFIRGGIFKKEIPRLYNHQCCISEMKIETTINAQLVDACHIIPFSFSNDDTISNGICLSPNLHRAYDRGLLTITEDYIVRISPTVRETQSPYGIMQFAGKRIALPQEYKHYPSVQNLSWHRKEKFVM